jgi:hypothetical protein
VTAPGRLYLHRLTYQDFLGQRELRAVDFDDDLTVFQGPNGAGKSTALAALMVALSLDATAIQRYIHLGAADEPSRPEINLWLRDAAGVQRAHIRVRPSGREVREFDGRDWRVVRKPVEWVCDLRDPAAMTSIFRDASIDEKVTMLLEAIATRVPYDRIEALAATGVADMFAAFVVPEGLTWLEELERFEKHIYDTRTATNGEKQRKKDLAQELLSSLPAEVPEDAAADLEACESKAQKLSDGIAKAEAEIAAFEREALQKAQAERDADVAALQSAQRESTTSQRAELSSKAAELRAACERRISELTEALDLKLADEIAATTARVAEANRRRDETEAKAREFCAGGRDLLTGQKNELADAREYIATLRERATRAASDADQRRKAADAQALADKHAARADELTEAIAGLRRYKAGLAADTGIPGLRIHFPEAGTKGKPTMTLDVNGAQVPLEQVNTGRMEELAVEVTALRAQSPENGRPHLLIAIIDNAESVDPARLRAKAGAGIQIVAAVRHGDGPGEPLRVVAGEAVTA